jgi:hypothetical protein
MEHWKLTIGNEKQVPVINLFYANSRYRYWTGRAIGLKLTSHDNPELLKATSCFTVCSTGFFWTNKFKLLWNT